METPSGIRYTYRDHQSIPEDHRRHEIIDGELIVTPIPRFNHQLVAANLVVLLRAWTLESGLGDVVGPITVHIHDELVLEPDLVFVRTERRDLIDPEGDIHGPPDLVVEILSPSTRSYDRNLKRKRYLAGGVAELWLVDVDRREVEVWRRGEEEPELVTEVLHWTVGEERFELPLEGVFRGVREG